MLDIILESFEYRAEHKEFFLELLTSYLTHCDVAGFCHLAGFKFQFYHVSIRRDMPVGLFSIFLSNNICT